MTPRVSIGVPVYNGAARLPDALRNLATQTFRDIEIIVSDNASTDGSAEIATGFAERDPRFRVIRQTQNLGPLPNFQAVAEAATAPRFLWRADDDLCSPDFVARLNAALDQAPGAVLAVPRRVKIRIGKAKREVAPVPARLADMPPAALLAASNPGWMYGMMQTAYVRETIAAVLAEYPHIWAWDHLMIFPAIAAGQVTGDDAALFFHRLEQRGETAARPATKTMRKDFAAFCDRRMPPGTAALHQVLKRQMRRHFGA